MSSSTGKHKNRFFYNMHLIGPIWNYSEKEPKIEGQFSYEETLYRRRKNSIFIAETLFWYEVPGGLHFSQGESTLREETLFRDTKMDF